MTELEIQDTALHQEIRPSGLNHIDSQEGFPNLEELTESPNNNLDFIGSSAVLDSSPFDLTTRNRKKRHIMGNSASGLILHPKNGLKQEMPRSIFSSMVCLPKLKECESHKKFASIYKKQNPPTFDVPPYRGYQTDMKNQLGIDSLKQKKPWELLDSRYRRKEPLKQVPHLTWTLQKKIDASKYPDGLGKVKIKDMENYQLEVEMSEKTEKEYLKHHLEHSVVEDDPYDYEGKDLVGSNALKEYNTHYKLISKIECENKIKERNNSVYTTILSSINNKNLLPMKMNVVKNFGNTSSINTE